MATVKFSFVQNGNPVDMPTMTLTHMDTRSILAMMDEVADKRRKITGLKGWSGINDKFHFQFNTRDNMNYFHNVLAGRI